MFRSRLAAAALVAVFAASAAAPPALAAHTRTRTRTRTQTRANPVLADCQRHGGTLSRRYTVAELQHALNGLSPSVREYTTCYTAIENQLNQQIGGTQIGNLGSSSNSGGGSGTVILIVVVVVVLLGGGGAAAWASRRNRGTTD